MVKSFQNHVDRAKKVDQDVMELQEKAENNIRIKKEFEDLRTEVQEAFKNQVEVIQRQDDEIEEIKESANILIKERNQTLTDVAQIASEVNDIRLWKEEIAVKTKNIVEENYDLEEKSRIKNDTESKKKLKKKI